MSSPSARKPAKWPFRMSKLPSSGSICAACASCASMCSIADSSRWVISPRRMAPASRALPLSVCSARRLALRASRRCGCAAQSRSAVPSTGSSSAASSSKIGNRSGSSASSTSMSSSMALSRPTAGCSAASAADSGSGSPAAACGASISGAKSALSSWAQIASSASSPWTAAPSPAALPISLWSTCCSASSTDANGVLRKPAANWCSRRRISLAAAWNTTRCWASPKPWGLTCISACSSARDRRDKSLKPTVAELPASECAQPTASSGCGRWASSAHSCSATSRRRDHSSASFR